jgi:hypothetical protein
MIMIKIFNLATWIMHSLVNKNKLLIFSIKRFYMQIKDKKQLSTKANRIKLW